jgi:hypothetical protein
LCQFLSVVCTQTILNTSIDAVLDFTTYRIGRKNLKRRKAAAQSKT